MAHLIKSKRITVDIPDFGTRFCGDDVEFKLGYDNNGVKHYFFYKQGTMIKHNEYGPSYEDANGVIVFRLNDKEISAKEFFENLELSKILKANKLYDEKWITKKDETNNMKEDLMKVKKNLTNDAIEVSYRVGGERLLEITTNSLVSSLRKVGASEDVIKLVNTEFGKMLVGILVGYLPSMMPNLVSDSKIQHLLKEVELQSMQRFLNDFILTIQQPLMLAFEDLAKSLPDKAKE